MEMLRFYSIPMSGKEAVVIGRSMVVGKPMSMLLLGENATVTVCHSKTRTCPASANGPTSSWRPSARQR
jgi:methylenetetrahydrofolate dehydrogenase (NADP+)/methenyltetrahydrofolate cyclohydrolase